ncbi:FliO/MopB family protein [Brachyspira sp.]|uniref:FliO/MopB family protein n=1 Tax=Brachyspira sp. TaxID=1977261 RepID=UPI003D7CC557
MKKIIIFLMIIIPMVYAQDNNNNSDNINTNETNTNFFNIPAENENNTNNEPAILEDIRNIENRATVSNTGMFIRAIIGFILTLAGIYLVFIYLKNRTKKISGSNEIIRILATTAVAANRYISIIEIADEMYLISISDHNINLLEKIENKEIKDQIRMMYINSKENAVEDSFKNILNQTLSIFRQPKMKEKDALQSTKEIRERLRNLNSDSLNNNEENKDRQ